MQFFPKNLHPMIGSICGYRTYRYRALTEYYPTPDRRFPVYTNLTSQFGGHSFRGRGALGRTGRRVGVRFSTDTQEPRGNAITALGTAKLFPGEDTGKVTHSPS